MARRSRGSAGAFRRASRAAGEGRTRTVRVGDLEVSYDEAHALAAYRRIRAGSLIGAAFTREAFRLLEETVGPGWRDRVMQAVAGAGEMEESEAVEEGDGESLHH